MQLIYSSVSIICQCSRSSIKMIQFSLLIFLWITDIGCKLLIFLIDHLFSKYIGLHSLKKQLGEIQMLAAGKVYKQEERGKSFFQSFLILK